MKFGLAHQTTIFLAALLSFHTIALAGTNDLLQSQVTWTCVSTDLVNNVSSRPFELRLKNQSLINLAMGSGAASKYLRIGFQSNCSNLEMNVVIYDMTTMTTVLTLADIVKDSYTSNGKTVHISCSGNVHSNGFLLGGQLVAQMTTHFDSNACIKQAKISVTGTIQVQTTNGLQTLSLRIGKLRTAGLQLRPIATTGSGNYGSGGTLTSSGDSSGASETIGGVSNFLLNGDPSLTDPTRLYTYGSIDLETNAVVNFVTVRMDPSSFCDGSLTMSAGEVLLSPSGLALCTNSVINLNSGSVLNVCTNGIADDALHVLQGAVSGEGTLNLIDCANPTSP